jgi:hypothetical protein
MSTALRIGWNMTLKVLEWIVCVLVWEIIKGFIHHVLFP